MSDTYITGIRGCAGKTKRRGEERYCAQQWVVVGDDGKTYCWYHDPENPHKFGQGYYADYVKQGKDPHPNRMK